jgi:hypothetical protein
VGVCEPMAPDVGSGSDLVLFFIKSLARIYRSPVQCFAQPNKKAPVATVKIFCSKCGAYLYKYRKVGLFLPYSCLCTREKP